MGRCRGSVPAAEREHQHSRFARPGRGFGFGLVEQSYGCWWVWLVHAGGFDGDVVACDALGESCRKLIASQEVADPAQHVAQQPVDVAAAIRREACRVGGVAAVPAGLVLGPHMRRCRI